MARLIGQRAAQPLRRTRQRPLARSLYRPDTSRVKAKIAQVGSSTLTLLAETGGTSGETAEEITEGTTEEIREPGRLIRSLLIDLSQC